MSRLGLLARSGTKINRGHLFDVPPGNAAGERCLICGIIIRHSYRSGNALARIAHLRKHADLLERAEGREYRALSDVYAAV